MQRTIRRVTFHTLAAPQMKRVAAYARVSSDKDPMGHSLSAQISYYNTLIQKHPDWTLVGIYADEGITGTRADRPEFVRLLADCRAGKIDMVLTKSISRFARNTVTLLETVRELKELGIDVYYILRNERYCGNVLTWKTFTADMFEHKHKRNRQDRDQYLYTNHHDAIISVETFEAAQTLMANRRHHIQGGLPTIQVIDDGIFRGYIPINHHWINDDPGTYFDASNSVEKKEGIRRIRRSSFSAFDLEGYQVVRGQFLTARPDCPCISLVNGKITFNTVCMKKFEEVEYIQLLLHPAERKMAIRPCGKNDTHSIKWRPDATKALIPKTISCPHFSNALYQIMDWNPDYAYRVRGTWAKRGVDEIIVFPLQNAEPAAYMEVVDSETEKVRRRRTTLCPEEWNDSFGEEFYDYALENSFYYLAPRADWNAQAKSILAPGVKQISVLTPEELQASIEELKVKVE